MNSQLVVNVTSYETRVALLENGVVSELYIERIGDRGLVGNIYWGKVQRVLPGMQAAFIELGLGKAAFLYVGDVMPPELSDEAGNLVLGEEPIAQDMFEAGASEEESEEGEGADKQRFYWGRKRKPKQRIEDLLRPGQMLLVQVTKDPISTKGPRVTCNISLPGRHVVFMTTFNHIGVSRKITDEEQRNRLKQVLSEQKPKSGGFVARTVAQEVDDDKLKADCAFLVSLWNEINEKTKGLHKPMLVQPELDLVLKCAREMTNENLDKIVVDNEAAYQRTKHFLSILEPKLAEKIELYTSPQPIFDTYGVEAEITRAMSRKVWLKSGGYLIIDQAEALTVIDVNTGKFVGRRNLEDTILRTNLEAVKEVAYQLRLRNIGGMVIIDFIDMENQEDRDRVLAALFEALRRDRAKCNVVKISELGLVEMTRQRNRESLERQLCEPCFYCDGKGTLKSKRTIVYEIFRTLEQKAKYLSEPVAVVHAHPEIVDLVYKSEEEVLKNVETSSQKQIVVRPRGSFHQEQYDIFGTKKI